MQIMNWLLCRIYGTSFRVVVENEDQVELSFTRMWDPSLEGKSVPLNIDKRSFSNHILCLFLLINIYIYIYGQNLGTIS